VWSNRKRERDQLFDEVSEILHLSLLASELALGSRSGKRQRGAEKIIRSVAITGNPIHLEHEAL